MQVLYFGAVIRFSFSSIVSVNMHFSNRHYYTTPLQMFNLDIISQNLTHTCIAGWLPLEHVRRPQSNLSSRKSNSS